MNGGGGRSLLIAVAAVVIAAVVAGLLVLGSPRDERARRFDESRLTDLQQLRTAIDLHYRREGALPDSLEELARRSPLPVRMTEPEGGRLYDYDVIDSTSYRLCATFNFPSPGDRRGPIRVRIVGARRGPAVLPLPRAAHGPGGQADAGRRARTPARGIARFLAVARARRPARRSAAAGRSIAWPRRRSRRSCSRSRARSCCSCPGSIPGSPPATRAS